MGNALGGHESRQTVNALTHVAANTLQQATQNCVTMSAGANTVSVNGNGNIASGIDQSISFSVAPKCVTNLTQNNSFSSSVADKITQELKDKQVAGLQWMDGSKDDQVTNIKQDVVSNFNQKTVQNCINRLDGYNTVAVKGNSNVVSNVKQRVSTDVISDCLLGNQQTSKTISDIANTTNQHSEYTAENPLAFIGDAMKSLGQSVMAVAAVIIIVVICFVFLFMGFGRGGGSTSAPQMPPVMFQMSPSGLSPRL